MFLNSFSTNKINETVAGVCALYPPLYLYLKMLGKPDDCFEGAQVIEGSFDFYNPLVFMYLGLAHVRANWFRKWVAWRLDPKKNIISTEEEITPSNLTPEQQRARKMQKFIEILLRDMLLLVATVGLIIPVESWVIPWLKANPAGRWEKRLYLVLSLYILFDCVLAIWMLCFIPPKQTDSVTNVFGMFRLMAETFESRTSLGFLCSVFGGWFVDFEKGRIERTLMLLREKQESEEKESEETQDDQSAEGAQDDDQVKDGIEMVPLPPPPKGKKSNDKDASRPSMRRGI